MHEKISNIQNAFWKAYKDFLQTMDVKQYNDAIDTLLEKHRHDRTMINFCQALCVAWTPIINGVKEWS